MQALEARAPPPSASPPPPGGSDETHGVPTPSVRVGVKRPRAAFGGSEDSTRMCKAARGLVAASASSTPRGKSSNALARLELEGRMSSGALEDAAFSDGLMLATYPNIETRSIPLNQLLVKARHGKLNFFPHGQRGMTGTPQYFSNIATVFANHPNSFKLTEPLVISWRGANSFADVDAIWDIFGGKHRIVALLMAFCGRIPLKLREDVVWMTPSDHEEYGFETFIQKYPEAEFSLLLKEFENVHGAALPEQRDSHNFLRQEDELVKYAPVEIQFIERGTDDEGAQGMLQHYLYLDVVRVDHSRMNKGLRAAKNGVKLLKGSLVYKKIVEGLNSLSKNLRGEEEGYMLPVVMGFLAAEVHLGKTTCRGLLSSVYKCKKDVDLLIAIVESLNTRRFEPAIAMLESGEVRNWVGARKKKSIPADSLAVAFAVAVSTAAENGDGASTFIRAAEYAVMTQKGLEKALEGCAGRDGAILAWLADKKAKRIAEMVNSLSKLTTLCRDKHSPQRSPSPAEVYSPQRSPSPAEVYSPQRSPSPAEVYSPQRSPSPAELCSPQRWENESVLEAVEYVGTMTRASSASSGSWST